MAPASILMIVAIVAEAAALVLLLRRRGWQTLPIFSIFLAYSVLSDVTMDLLSINSPDSYAHYYLTETVIDSVLQFAVMVELSWAVLRPIRKSLPRQTVLVLGAVIFLAGLAIWPLSGKTMPPDMGPNSTLIFHLEQTVAILRVALFVVIASFSQVLSIGWHDRELQIATGFGFYSIVSLLVALIHSHQVAGNQYRALDYAEVVSYVCTLTYWVYSFSTKEQERREFSPQMQNFLLLMGGGARTGRVALTNLPRDRFKNKD